MTDIINFLMSIDIFARNPYLIDIIFFGLSCLLSFLLFGKKGFLNFIKGGIKRLLYRKQSYREDLKERGVATGQTFERFKPIYRLNKETNELVDTGEVIDIHEVIQSCKDSVLSSVLDRFFPEESLSDNEIEYADNVDNLDRMAELGDLITEYRERYKLDDGLSIKQVIQAVQSRNEELKQKIKSKKEELENAQTNKPQGEQTPLQENGE